MVNGLSHLREVQELCMQQPSPKQTKVQSIQDNKQQTTTKLAAEVIEVLHENSLLEMTSVQCSPRSHLFWPSSPQHDAQ